MCIDRFKQAATKSAFYLILLFSSLGFLQSCSSNTTNTRQVDRQLPRDEQVKEAQVINEEAQANYYDKQAENSGSFWIAYSAPITTVIGVLIAVLTISLQSRNAGKLEEQKRERAREDEKDKWEQTRKDELEKWNRTREDELEKWNRLREDEKEKRYQTRKDEISRETRQAAADLIKKIAIAAHSMTWVLWVAGNDLEHFSRRLVIEHDERMNALYTDLVAAQVVLASLNKTLYQRTQSMVSSIYSYDDQLARKAKVIDDTEKKSDFDNYKKKVEELGALWTKVYEFSQNLPNKFADMLDVKLDLQNQEEKKTNDNKPK